MVWNCRTTLKLSDESGPTISDHTKQHYRNKRSMITPEARPPVIIDSQCSSINWFERSTEYVLPRIQVILYIYIYIFLFTLVRQKHADGQCFGECSSAGADLGGGCRGCAHPPSPEMTCSFLIQLVSCQKKNYVVHWSDWCWSRARDECTPS